MKLNKIVEDVGFEYIVYDEDNPHDILVRIPNRIFGNNIIDEKTYNEIIEKYKDYKIIKRRLLDLDNSTYSITIRKPKEKYKIILIDCDNNNILTGGEIRLSNKQFGKLKNKMRFNTKKSKTSVPKKKVEFKFVKSDTLLYDIYLEDYNIGSVYVNQDNTIKTFNIYDKYRNLSRSKPKLISEYLTSAKREKTKIEDIISHMEVEYYDYI